MADERPDRPRIAVLGTGGTIAFEGSGPFDLVDYGERSRIMPIGELLQRVPQLAELAELDARDVVICGSNEVGPETWLRLRREVVDVFTGRPEPTGIVITHGTATLEETAYFLHLTVPTEKPIVVTGAQRPLTLLGSDVAANLAAAIRVAASERARGIGVTVVLNDEIHSARDVTKAAVSRLNAFRSGDLGPLGYVEAGGAVVVYRHPTRLHTTKSRFSGDPTLDGVPRLPRVEIVYGYAGSDGEAIRSAVASGSQAVVLAALVPGLLTPGEEDAVGEALTAGAVVVLATRAGTGRVVHRSVDRERGIVSADDLTPQKARVLAMLALLQTRDPGALLELYDCH
jgi:L-asparaginase